MPQPWSPYTIPSISLKASPSNTAIPLNPRKKAPGPRTSYRLGKRQPEAGTVDVGHVSPLMIFGHYREIVAPRGLA
jgi:hypothetical protein